LTGADATLPEKEKLIGTFKKDLKKEMEGGREEMETNDGR